MGKEYEEQNPMWLESVECDHHQEISNWLDEIKKEPSLFRTYHPDHKMVMYCWNRTFDEIKRRINQADLWGFMRPENFSRAIEPLIEAYEETFKNPVCRYSFETNLRSVVAKAQNSQPELVEYLDDRISHLAEVPNHPELLENALNSADSVSDSLSSEAHANLLYVIGLTRNDNQEMISSGVEGSKGTIYEPMLDLERLRECANLSEEGLSRFGGEDFENVSNLVSSIKYFSEESMFLNELKQYHSKRGDTLMSKALDFLNNLSISTYRIFS